MPNIVNEILLEQLEKDIKDSGSCLVLSFDRLSVAEVSDLRNQLRDCGINYHVGGAWSVRRLDTEWPPASPRTRRRHK